MFHWLSLNELQRLGVVIIFNLLFLKIYTISLLTDILI